MHGTGDLRSPHPYQYLNHLPKPQHGLGASHLNLEGRRRLWTTKTRFDGWVIIELMGHRRLTGYLSEQEIAGRAFLRIDVPGEPPSTQFYGAEAVYCITPTTEETARNSAALNNVAPIHRWELPPPSVRPGDDDYVDADIVGDPF